MDCRSLLQILAQITQTEQILYIPLGYLESIWLPKMHANFAQTKGFQGVYSLSIYEKEDWIVLNDKTEDGSGPSHAWTAKENYFTLQDIIKLLKLIPNNYKIWALVDSMYYYNGLGYIEMTRFTLSSGYACLGSSELYWT